MSGKRSATKVGGNKQGKRARKDVLILASNEEIQERIETLTALNKEQNNKSNKKEYCALEEGQSSTCARTNPRRIDRKLQIKTSKIENQHGPLSRLQKKRSEKTDSVTVTNGDRLILLPEGIEERLLNMEEHLQLETGPTVGSVPRDVYERIKMCEDRILELEEIASCEEFLAFMKARRKEKRLEKQKGPVKASIIMGDKEVRGIERHLKRQTVS